MTTKEQEKNFLGDGNILYLDYGGSYAIVYIVKMHSTVSKKSTLYHM